jgi:hypothetical protein
MGFLDSVDLENVVEPSTVPADAEYKLRIVDVKTDPSTPDGLPRDKNGNSYLLPRFEILDEPTAKDFTRFIGLPHDSMDAKKKNSSGFMLKTFLQAFDLEQSALVDPSDMIGAEGWAILGIEDTEQYGEQNYVKKFIVPK